MSGGASRSLWYSEPREVLLTDDLGIVPVGFRSGIGLSTKVREMEEIERR